MINAINLNHHFEIEKLKLFNQYNVSKNKFGDASTQ